MIAAAGPKKRTLATSLPSLNTLPNGFDKAEMAMPGVMCLQANAFTTYESAAMEMNELNTALMQNNLSEIALILVCDDALFTAKNSNNMVWVTYTRSNPSHDIYGVDSFTRNKHWGCNGPLIIDARKKPFHAPELIKDAATEKRVDELFTKGHSLHRLGI